MGSSVLMFCNNHSSNQQRCAGHPLVALPTSLSLPIQCPSSRQQFIPFQTYSSESEGKKNAEDMCQKRMRKRRRAAEMWRDGVVMDSPCDVVEPEASAWPFCYLGIHVLGVCLNR